ncbi:MAG: sigma 54-interacting transcriptional regulator [bacterium]|nr:sigma 54-interacting transcriptional regulator [bacterium]
MTKNTKEKILIIDDEAEILNGLSHVLGAEGYVVTTADRGTKGLELITYNPPDLVLLDVKMPDLDGLETLKRIKEYDEDIIVFIMTAYSDVKDAVKAIKGGAHDYFPKPFNLKETKEKLRKALREKELREEVLKLRKEFYRQPNFSNIITASPAMLKVFHELEKVAPSDISILITGESGTGKELIARAIHENSLRKEGPFIPVDCAAIPETLFENEVFGHEKGAYTSADQKRNGLFEMAHRGTLFLDEIGNLQPANQIKLLRAIQEKKIKYLGGKELIDVDVRIIAATNLDLQEAMQKCGFREELFYRINQFNIHLPPLRERKEDIILLANFFLERAAAKNGHPVKTLSPETIDILLQYDWPGNVRELESVIHGASILAKDQIRPEHLNYRIKSKTSAWMKLSIDIPVNASLKKVMKTTAEQVERAYIQKIFLKTGYKKYETSKLLGIGLKTLYGKLNKHNLCLKSREPNEKKNEPIIFSAGMTLQEAAYQVREKLEKWIIIKALRETEGKKYYAAKKLKVDYKTLWLKSKKYKIDNKAIYEEEIPRYFLGVDLSSELSLTEACKIALSAMEKELIQKTIEKTHGHKTEAAKILNIDYKTLYNKMLQHGMNERI